MSSTHSLTYRGSLAERVEGRNLHQWDMRPVGQAPSLSMEDGQPREQRGTSPPKSGLHRRFILGTALILVLVVSVGAFGVEPEHQLIRAARSGDVTAVKELLESGANVNVRDDMGRTPLIWASKKGHPFVAAVLLDSGADVNAKTREGVTALIMASYEGHADIVRLLLARGADAGVVDSSGKTAAKYAAFRYHDEIVRLLKEAERGR